MNACSAVSTFSQDEDLKWENGVCTDGALGMLGSKSVESEEDIPSGKEHPLHDSPIFSRQ